MTVTKRWGADVEMPPEVDEFLLPSDCKMCPLEPQFLQRVPNWALLTHWLQTLQLNSTWVGDFLFFFLVIFFFYFLKRLSWTACFRHFVDYGNKSHTSASGKNGKKTTTTTLEKSNYQVFSINEAKHFPLEYKRVKLPDYSTNLPTVHFFSWQGRKAEVSEITNPPNPPPSPPLPLLKAKEVKEEKARMTSS